MLTARGPKVIKQVNKNTGYKSEFYGSLCGKKVKDQQ